MALDFPKFGSLNGQTLIRNQQDFGRCHMDFREAVTAHLQWKPRLAIFIRGDSLEQLDPNPVSKEDQCELGKWLHGEAKSKFGDMLEYQGLMEIHATFHRCAGEIVNRHLSGDSTGAAKLLEEDFNAYSSATVLGITRLKKVLEEA